MSSEQLPGVCSGPNNIRPVMEHLSSEELRQKFKTVENYLVSRADGWGSWYWGWKWVGVGFFIGGGVGGWGVGGMDGDVVRWEVHTYYSGTWRYVVLQCSHRNLLLEERGTGKV